MDTQYQWVYIESEPGLWTVGFYDPDGKWKAESDHRSVRAAAARVHFLNGGTDPDLLNCLKAVMRHVSIPGQEAVLQIIDRAARRIG